MDIKQKLVVILLVLALIGLTAIYLILSTKPTNREQENFAITPTPTYVVSSILFPTSIKIAPSPTNTPNTTFAPKPTLNPDVLGESGGILDVPFEVEQAAMQRQFLLSIQPISQEAFSLSWDKNTAKFIVTLNTETGKYDFEAWLGANFPDLGLDEFSIR